VAKLEYEEAMKKIIGEENIPLHNHLIRSILRNVMHPEEVAGPRAKPGLGTM
jgi:hypothetical protein